jgi:DNA repair protein SbcC/Rad50
MTKHYPRIFSLSTVGIRNHYHVDYKLHPIRTDFTGDSGIGKTIIADLLQLIFVGEKEFKSATEAHDERNPRKLPIDRFGYTFINIEVNPSNYLVIGVFISSGGIDPFIIQQGYDWGEDYTPLNSPFSYKGILFNDSIIDLDSLTEKLKEVNCKKFSFKKYHEFLRMQKLLSIDLTRGNNLKNYAQIIRYFSRGKGFKNNPEWLKQFFFSGNKEDDIFRRFQSQLSEIKEDLEDHKRNKEEIDSVKHKEKLLIELKTKKEEKEEAEKEYLKAKVIFHKRNAENAKHKIEELEKNVRQLNLKITLLRIEYFINKIKDYEANIDEVATFAKKVKEIEIKTKVSKENISKYESKKNDAEKIFPDFDKKLQQVIAVDKWIITYQTYDNLRIKFYSQLKNKEEREGIQRFIYKLKQSELYDFFNDSKWAADIDEGNEYFKNEIVKAQDNKKRLEALIKFTNVDDENSIAKWAMDNAQKLSLEQESVLVRFQELPLKKPKTVNTKSQYLPNPEKLFYKLNIAEKEANGFWLNLNGIYDFVEYIPKQIFNTGNKEEIIAYFKENHEKASEMLAEVNSLIVKIESVKKLIDETGIETARFFNGKKEIENFDVDDSLNKSKDEFEEYLKIHFYGKEIRKHKKEIDEYLELKIKGDDYLNSVNLEIRDIQKYLKKHNLESEDNTEILIQNLHLLISNNTELIQLNKTRLSFYNSIKEQFSHEEIEKLQSLIDTAHVYDKIVDSKSEKKNFKSRVKQLQSAIVDEERQYDEFLIKYEAVLAEKFNTKLKDYEGKYENPEAKELNEKKLKQESFNRLYKEIIDNFIEENSKFQYVDSDDFPLLAKSILPEVIALKIIQEDSKVLQEIRNHLTQLTNKYTELGDRKINILKEILIDVKDAHDEYTLTIHRLANYFRGNDKQISQGYNLRIKTTPSDSYPIKWIDDFIQKFDEFVRKERMHSNLFESLKEKIDVVDMMISAYKSCGGKEKSPELKELLNPKRYFNIEFSMKSDDGEHNVGSAGQTYASVALLCIARLSLIQNTEKTKKQEGLYFMPIDEAESIGSNFDLLEKIAKANGFQLIVMSIRPLDDFKEGEQYQYMLNGQSGKDKRISTFAIFSEAEGNIEYSSQIEKGMYE